MDDESLCNVRVEMNYAAMQKLADDVAKQAVIRAIDRTMTGLIHARINSFLEREIDALLSTPECKVRLMALARAEVAATPLSKNVRRRLDARLAAFNAALEGAECKKP